MLLCRCFPKILAAWHEPLAFSLIAISENLCESVIARAIISPKSAVATNIPLFAKEVNSEFDNHAVSTLAK